MYKFYDFKCNGPDCKHHEKIKEIMILEGEEPECIVCKRIMERLFPAPKGFVKGSSTPVKQ